MTGDPVRVQGITVAALTQGVVVPSTRFRVTQHMEALARRDVHIRHLPARFGSYPPRFRVQRVPWSIAALAESSLRVIEANRADVVLLQRELLSTLRTAERFIRRPYVFDVDDAIFANARGDGTNQIARSAAVTICGNSFLAEHYQALSPVVVIPTAVDTDRFVPAAETCELRPVIGWSGSSSGFEYLYEIEDALRIVLDKNPDAVVHVVADRQPEFALLPPDRVQFQRWSPDIEILALQQFTVGLMPLRDSVWARGKCSFKMLTYMSVGVPVVVSPVGMNREVLALGPCGHAAGSRDEWVQALCDVLSNRNRASLMGKEGRRIAVEHYSQAVLAPRLGEVIRSVACGRGKLHL